MNLEFGISPLEMIKLGREEEVIKYLPHRYPFLLIDRVLEVIEGEKLVAIKNVTINEPFFKFAPIKTVALSIWAKSGSAFSFTKSGTTTTTSTSTSTTSTTKIINLFTT